MKVAILGDVHGGASKSSDIIHDYMEKSYAFFFDYLNQHNIKTIVQEGDLYDDRKVVYFNTLYRFNDYFIKPLETHGIDMYVIAGNHDVVHRNTNRINSVRLLKTKRMHVVDMVPETISLGSVKMDLYPWINTENYDASMAFCRESTSQYACGHFEFAQFPMHPGSIAEKGMSHELFGKYEEVYSGHYHTISQKDNVLYTGTPCQLNWSDWNDPKGFWILDTETGKREFIQNPYTLFEKISYVEGMTYDFNNVTDKYVKIVILESKNQKKFDAFLDNVNLKKPHDVKVIEASIQDAVATAVGVTDLVSTNQMIATVIDNMELDVDKTKLKNFILELYSEAMAINNAL